MRKFKKGDIVKVRRFTTRPSHWNNLGGMDGAMGGIFEICYDGGRFFNLKACKETQAEFRGCRVGGWNWREGDTTLMTERTFTERGLVKI